MKNNSNRLKYTLVAAMMTGMIALLGWTFSSNTVSADSGTVEQLQAENAQLRQTLAEMQAREDTFRTEIQKANETIFQLIDQPEPTALRLGGSQPSQPVAGENTAQQNTAQQNTAQQNTTEQNIASQPESMVQEDQSAPSESQPKTLSESVQNLFSFGLRARHEHDEHEEHDEHDAWEHSGG